MGDISNRKQDHLQLCLENDVNSTSPAGWDSINIPHRALPEIDLNDVDLSCSFLDQNYSAPLLISSMSGGIKPADQLNSRLAHAAAHFGIPMGVGSQRIAAEEKNRSFAELKKHSPNTVFFANIGAVQLNYSFTEEHIKKIIDDIEAQALILHCNPLQEAIQNEGDTNFSQLLSKISTLKKTLPIPLIVKETGCGLDGLTARRLVECGVDALDIAGKGGTHWGYIEGLRHTHFPELGSLFRDWGETSASLLEQLKSQLPRNYPLIASGGIRHGLDGAKALYAGAQFFAMARPILLAAHQGTQTLEDFLQLHLRAVKIALFCSGKRNPKEWTLEH